MGRIVPSTQFNWIQRILAVWYVKTFFFTVKASKSITALKTVRTIPCKDPDRKKPPTKVTTLHWPDA